MKTDKSKTKPIMFLKIDFEFSFFPGFVCDSFCKKSSAMKKIEHFLTFAFTVIKIISSKDKYNRLKSKTEQF